MLEARSPLGLDARFEAEGITLSEAPGFLLMQYAGSEKALKKALGRLPAQVGIVVERNNATLFRLAPHQIWQLGGSVVSAEGVYVTPLSSARTRILLEGPRACDLLASCALIDFSPSQFKPGHFVMTGIHHTPVTIHCIGETSFHIYALRTFALDTWEWLCDAAQGLEPVS
jgi:methylglutamate dehydrogenase subunit D